MAPCVFAYHPSLKNSFVVSVGKNSKLSKISPETLIIPFMQPNSPWNLLMRAEVYDNRSNFVECRSCDEKRCKRRLQMHHSPSFHSKATENKYRPLPSYNWSKPIESHGYWHWLSFTLYWFQILSYNSPICSMQTNHV